MFTVRGAGHDQAALVLVAVVSAADAVAASTFLSRTVDDGAGGLSHQARTHKHAAPAAPSLAALRTIQ